MSEETQAQGGGPWESIKRSLQEGASLVMGKAEELTQTGRARLDVAAAKARVSRLQGELGARVYDLVESGRAVAEDAEVRALCEQLGAARAELAEEEGALAEIKAELRASVEPPEAPPASTSGPPPA